MDNNNHPVTKKELNQALNDWTYTEIAPVVESMFEKFGEKMDNKFEEINNNIKASENRILNSNDNLAGVIKKDHEELAAEFMTAKRAEEKLEKFGNTLAEHGNFLSTLGFQPA